MWNNRKSMLLSIFCTCAAIIFVVLFAIFLPLLPKLSYAGNSIFFDREYLAKVMLPLYACCVPAIGALLSLLRMLMDIWRGNVFTKANVRRLRIISWCFFAIFIILILTAIFRISSPAILLIAIASGFFFLLIRTVKNVIDAARELKEENDFTI